MDFCVIYMKDDKVESCVISEREYDIIAITREAKRRYPGIDVRCIIPRKS